jgi:hypothetical protein
MTTTIDVRTRVIMSNRGPRISTSDGTGITATYPYAYPLGPEADLAQHRAVAVRFLIEQRGWPHGQVVYDSHIRRPEAHGFVFTLHRAEPPLAGLTPEQRTAARELISKVENDENSYSGSIEAWGVWQARAEGLARLLALALREA